MKKTSAIILTLLISLSINISVAQSNFDPTLCPTDSICNNVDTLYCDCEMADVRYDYYFRMRLLDNMFRFCFPNKYQRLVYGPGHEGRMPIYSYGKLIQHHHHQPNGTLRFFAFNHGGSSTKRGGFGHFGSGHSQSN